MVSRATENHRITLIGLNNQTGVRGLAISRPNQVWSTDITHIRLRRGWVYLVAILDWATRAVLNWRVSNTCDRFFCIEALEEALRIYGSPEIFIRPGGSCFLV